MNLQTAEYRAQEAISQVNHGLEAFASVMKEIRDQKLYLETHPTFEAYCPARWGKTIRTVERALKAAETREQLLVEATSVSPQMLPVINKSDGTTMQKLAKIPAKKRLKVIEKIVAQNKPVTAKAVSAEIPVGYKKDAFGRLCRDLSGYNPYTEAVKAKPKPCPHCNGTGVEP